MPAFLLSGASLAYRSYHHWESFTTLPQPKLGSGTKPCITEALRIAQIDESVLLSRLQERKRAKPQFPGALLLCRVQARCDRSGSESRRRPVPVQQAHFGLRDSSCSCPLSRSARQPLRIEAGSTLGKLLLCSVQATTLPQPRLGPGFVDCSRW